LPGTVAEADRKAGLLGEKKIRKEGENIGRRRNGGEGTTKST